MADQDLHVVRYAFDAAFQRMCEAQSVDDLMAELSNLLHHLCRLRDLCIGRLHDPPYFARAARSAALEAAEGASWARNLDTHQLFRTAQAADMYTDYYAELYGVLAWRPRSELPPRPDGHDRDLAYVDELEGRPVLDTLRKAFDAMAALLQQPGRRSGCLAVG